MCRVKIERAGKRSATLLALTTTTTGGKSLWLRQSYRERMKAARAEARAKREAEQASAQRRPSYAVEVRRLAMEAVKAGIRAKGDKVHAL